MFHTLLLPLHMRLLSVVVTEVPVMVLAKRRRQVRAGSYAAVRSMPPIILLTRRDVRFDVIRRRIR